MPCAGTIIPPSRSDPVVRRIVAGWRRLTGGSATRDTGRPTLVACSGGADSSALLLALATVSPPPAAAHVLHDMRPRAEAEADRDATARLCEQLGVEFHEGRARVAGLPGNAEANARGARESALAQIAGRTGRAFVATGHHADDQLETVLMRLMRGSGVRGLGGIHPRRRLAEGIVLVRPMLGVTRAEAHGLCARCGWAWAEDRTNADVSRLRAAIRERVIPAMLEIEPGAARRASRLAQVQRDAHRAISAMAGEHEARAEIMTGQSRFDRSELRRLPGAVVAELICRQHHSKAGGYRRDRFGHRELSACVRAILAGSGELREFEFGGMRVRVCMEWVEFLG